MADMNDGSKGCSALVWRTMWSGADCGKPEIVCPNASERSGYSGLGMLLNGSAHVERG